MLELNLLDETFDRNQSHNYHLSVQIDNDAISMCILDKVRNKYIGLRHHHIIEHADLDILSVFKSALEIEDLLQLRYKSVSNLILNVKNTLVPIPYYEENKKESLFRFNLSASLNANILVNKIPIFGINSIFSYSKDLQKILNLTFHGIKFYHHSTPYLEYLANESENGTRPKCFVRINNNTLDIGIAQNKTLIFYNSFVYKEYSDITFYILSVLDKFKLSTMTTDVFMSVGNKNQLDIVDFLNKYLNKIRFIRPSNQFTYSYIFDESLLTCYSNLFNLALCE